MASVLLGEEFFPAFVADAGDEELALLGAKVRERIGCVLAAFPEVLQVLGFDGDRMGFLTDGTFGVEGDLCHDAERYVRFLFISIRDGQIARSGRPNSNGLSRS
jgi:hypothetical protein